MALIINILRHGKDLHSEKILKKQGIFSQGYFTI